MKEVTFDELIEWVQEDYEDFRNCAFKVGEGIPQSIERFFYEYKNLIEDGICEATVIFATLCIELKKYEVDSITKRHYDKLSKVIDSYDESKVASCLSDEEVKKLNVRVAEAKEILHGFKLYSLKK